MVEFDSITPVFLNLCTRYLIEETGVIINTLAKRLATLKSFLGEMRKQQINQRTDYEDFEASRNYDTTIMYLTAGELERLETLQLSDSTLSHIRDGFCFACHTGIRFSDWPTLSKHNVVDFIYEGAVIKALKFVMFKVHKEVVIPLDDYAISIIEKYVAHPNTNGKLFPIYSNQETNRGLKILAKEANIDTVVVDVKKSGATRRTYANPKHEILSCHDARNTFATLYLEKGGRPEVLKRLLGHSDIKQTMRYVKITERAVVEDHLKIYRNHLS